MIVYSPMRSGLLTGRFTAARAATIAVDDWRAGHDDFRPPGLLRNLAVVSQLQPLAEELGCPLPALAVAWTLAWPAVDGAIVGARRPDQLEGWIGAADVELDGALLDRIAAVLDENGAGPTRP